MIKKKNNLLKPQKFQSKLIKKKHSIGFKHKLQDKIFAVELVQHI